MVSVGKTLTQKRRDRGLTVAGLSERTGIGMAYLRALENDDFAALPGRAFGKLYIRAYAEVLRFDAAPLIAAYDEQAPAAEADAAPEIVAPEPGDAPPSELQQALRRTLDQARHSRTPPAPAGNEVEGASSGSQPPEPTAASAAGDDAPTELLEPSPDAGTAPAASAAGDDAPTELLEPSRDAGTTPSGAAADDAPTELPELSRVDGTTPSGAADDDAPTELLGPSPDAGTAPASAAAGDDAPTELIEPAPDRDQRPGPAALDGLPATPAVTTGGSTPDAGAAASQPGAAPVAPGASRDRLPGAARVILGAAAVLAVGALAWVFVRTPEKPPGSAALDALLSSGQQENAAEPDSGTPIETSPAARRTAEAGVAADRSPSRQSSPAATAPETRDSARPAVQRGAAGIDRPAGAAGRLTISEYGIGDREQDRWVAGRSDLLPEGSVAWFATRVLGGQSGERIRHVWLHEGSVVQVVELELGGTHWRTRSRKTLWGTGRWAVEARDASDRVLARAVFRCIPSPR